MTTIPLTAEGAKRLAEELNILKTVERPAAIEAIAVARSHGDLSENAEYDAARDRQSFVEGRIKEFESILSNANVIDPSLLDEGDKIVFGATVGLEDLESGAEVSYQIVGNVEANIQSNTISVASPLARALIGKYKGDVVNFMAPSGEREYLVLTVDYR